MAEQKIVEMDARGRLTVGTLIRKNGIEPSKFWQVTFGENQSIVLRPVNVVPA